MTAPAAAWPSPSSPNSHSRRTFDVFRVPADLNWELDLFGRVRRNYEAARAADAQAQEADAQNMKPERRCQRCRPDTTTCARSTPRSRSSTTRSSSARTPSLSRANAFRRASPANSTCSASAAELASNEADRASVERARAEMENALATLDRPTGEQFLPPSRTYALVGTFRPPRHPRRACPRSLLERRPDVAVAERGPGRGQRAHRRGRGGVFSRAINLMGAGGFESASIGQLFNWESTIWQIGPNVHAAHLSKGGRNVANLRVARAEYDENVARYRGQVLISFQDVENALVDLRTLAVQAEAQDRAVAASRRTLELSNQQFKQGGGNVSRCRGRGAHRAHQRAAGRAPARPADAGHRAAHQGVGRGLELGGQAARQTWRNKSAMQRLSHPERSVAGAIRRRRTAPASYTAARPRFRAEPAQLGSRARARLAHGPRTSLSNHGLRLRPTAFLLPSHA